MSDSTAVVTKGGKRAPKVTKKGENRTDKKGGKIGGASFRLEEFHYSANSLCGRARKHRLPRFIGRTRNERLHFLRAEGRLGLSLSLPQFV